MADTTQVEQLVNDGKSDAEIIAACGATAAEVSSARARCREKRIKKAHDLLRKIKDDDFKFLRSLSDDEIREVFLRKAREIERLALEAQTPPL